MTDRCFEALRPIFQWIIDSLRMKPAAGEAELPEGKGLYFLSEGNQCLYVGITGNLRRRWREHRFGRETGATFAIKLAREKTGRKATYTLKGGLQTLLKSGEFGDAFKEARSRISRMDLRFIEWKDGDDDDLAILEMYAARALDAKYNDFKTH